MFGDLVPRRMHPVCVCHHRAVADSHETLGHALAHHRPPVTKELGIDGVVGMHGRLEIRDNCRIVHRRRTDVEVGDLHLSLPSALSRAI